MSDNGMSPRARTALVLVVAVMGSLLWVPTSGAAAALPTGNLIRNPGAEIGEASDGQTVRLPTYWKRGPGSKATGISFAQAEAEGFPSVLIADEIGGEKKFFGGSPEVGEPTASFTQDIALSAEARQALDDAGGALATLMATAGGFGAQEDRITLSVASLDADGEEISRSSDVLGPTAAQRGNQTRFVRVSSNVLIAGGAHALRVFLTFVRGNTDPANQSANDAYADNLYLGFGSPVSYSRGIALGHAVAGEMDVFTSDIGPGGVGNCDAAKVSTLYRAKRGKDQLLATQPSDAQGLATFSIARRPGRKYYVTSPADGACVAVRSRTLRV